MSLSNTSANKNLPNSVPSERLWLRSELMGTQVITTDTGRRLGVVGEVVVDIDRREVVALGLRDNPLTRFLPGLPKWMPLESIKQVGDVILVDSLDSLSDSFLDGINVERLSKLISNQSSNAQFIVVSHRRPMISASERTIGVAQARGANTQVLGLPNAA